MKSVSAVLLAFCVVFPWLAASCGGAPSAPSTAFDGTALDAAVAAVPAEPAGEDDLKVPIGRDDPMRGKRDALVTIVLFSDFQCPFCSRLEPTLDTVRESYGDDVRIVWKNQPLPFHDRAKLAAEIGEGVRATKGNEAFWRYHDLVFARQARMNPETLRAWAVAAGADNAELEAGLERGAWTAKVERDMAVAKQVGATGTPTMRINGVLLSGAQPLEKIKSIIESELEKAKALLARSVPREMIYRVLVTENYTAPKEQHDDPEDREDTTTRWKALVGNAPVRGPKDAPVTIVEFADFQCPYCKRAEATLEQVRKTYGDKVRIVWKDEALPFHPRAKPAAEVARAARAQKGDPGFWEVHDKIFAAQPKLEDSDLEAIAKSSGLDLGRLRSALKSEQYRKLIEVDADEGEVLQASGTPHFFINGRRLVGAHPFEKFKAIIDDELKTFDEQKGKVAAKNYYDSLMAKAAGPPEPERKSATPPAHPAPFMGAANGKVVIQEWADFQCPFCARVEPMLEELVKAYPTQVKILWRDKPLPMHQDAALAAEAAREAHAQKGNAGFAQMRKLLFEHVHPDGLKRAALDAYAGQVGLDMIQFRTALDNHVHQATIEAEDRAGSAVGFTGTPAFLVGPYVLTGAQPVAAFKRLVELSLHPPAASANQVPTAAPAKPALPAGR